MKKVLGLFTYLLFSIIPLSAQLTDAVIETFASTFIIQGDDIYIVGASSIRKADISQGFPVTSIELVGGLDQAAGAVLNGNDLYFTEFFGGRISKIDITDPNPVPVVILNELSNPNRLLMRGNDLYFTETRKDRVAKIEITDQEPYIREVVIGISNPTSFVLSGNDMYISIPNHDKIVKADIFQQQPVIATDFITNIEAPSGLIIDQDILYFSLFQEGKVFKASIPDPSIPPKEVYSNLSQPSGLVINDNSFYISELGADKISVDASFVSAIINIQHGDIQIFPNPTQGLLNFQNVDAQLVEVFDNTGRLVWSKKNPGMNMDISPLPTGMYLLKITTEDKVYSAKVTKS